MKRILSFLEDFSRRGGAYALLLIVLALLSYGLALPKLGIYWDDWAMIWTRLAVGFGGLVRHFSFSRPLAGQIHNLAILLTGGDPLKVQLYAQAMRIVCALVFSATIRTVWRKSAYGPIPAVAGLIFFVYPGFTMIPIGINFGFSYLIMAIQFASWTLSVRALRGEGPIRPQVLAAALFSALNLFATEYFFLLELIRPALFWIALSAERPGPETTRERIARLSKAWFPYVFVFLAAVAYRLFFNPTQTLHYEFSLIDRFKSDPAAAAGTYLSAVGGDVAKVLFGAWAQLFILPDVELTGFRTMITFGAAAAAGSLVTGVFLSLRVRAASRSSDPSARPRVSAGPGMILVGLALILLGGQPFWLTDSYLSFIFPNSRFTLPFLPGMALVWGGVAETVFSDSARFRRVRCTLGIFVLAAIVGAASGFHFLNATAYRRDWTLTKDFFRQLSWRIPDLEPNTTIVTNTLPIRFSTDNSLTAPLNWIYADGEALRDARMPFMLYTNTKRSRTLSDFAPGRRVEQEYLTARFSGNTSDTISVYYRAPGCVRVLDPEIDLLNQTIANIDRAAARLTNYERIRTDGEARELNRTVFGAAPASKNWCWYYEQADLARQRQDWDRAARLGDEAFAQADYPNDPAERFPFIEGYAMAERWDDAERLSRETLSITPVMNNPLCALWARIERNGIESDAKAAAVRRVQSDLDCGFLGKGD